MFKKLEAKVKVLHSKQDSLATRLDALQSQIQVVSGMLKETIIFQQLCYQKGIITREQVQKELDRQHKALRNRLEEAGEQAALQPKDSRPDEGGSGYDGSKVSPDAVGGGDSSRDSGPRIWTPHL